MMEYKEGNIYYLRAPSDGMCKGDIARYPVFLPVKLIQKTSNWFFVIEPKGENVCFPLRPVWDQTGDIFAIGLIGTDEPLLAEYPSQEYALSEWVKYSQPEKYRWYVDELREKMKKGVYSDWECGYGKNGIKYILSAAKTLLTFGHQELEYPQEVINAICDISLLLFENDMPEWYEEIEGEDIPEQAAFFVDSAVREILEHNYFVSSTGTWDLLEGKFKHKDFEVSI